MGSNRPLGSLSASLTLFEELVGLGKLGVPHLELIWSEEVHDALGVCKGALQFSL